MHWCIDPAFAETLIRDALGAGASEAEVYQQESSFITAEVKRAELDAIEAAASYGYGLRTIRDGRLGLSYSTDHARAAEVIESALGMSAITAEDRFHSLPEPSGRVPDIDTCDPAIAEVTEAQAIGHALAIERAALENDARVARIRKASATFTTGAVHILNSKGVSASFRTSRASGSITAVAEHDGDAQQGWGYGAGRRLGAVDFPAIGAEAAWRACAMLGARKATTVNAPVLMHSSVAVEFLGVFASMLSSENVQKGKSLLAGRLGGCVISESLDIIDAPLRPDSPGCRPYDDEGVAACDRALIREGRLEGFMYNTYTARKDSVQSTANAVRGGYASHVSVGGLSIVLTPSARASGMAGHDELIRAMGRGMYVLDAMGVHTINPVSGDFSCGVSGLWVEQGEPAGPVKEAVISGNLLALFGRVDAVGARPAYYGSMAAPDVLFGAVDISG